MKTFSVNKIRQFLLMLVLVGVILSLCFGVSGSPAARAQVETPGASANNPLIPHPYHNFKAVCPPATEPGFYQCDSQVVTDTAGQEIVSDTLLTGAYGPAAFRGAYGVSGTTATNQTVAIVDAYDDPTALNDLDAYSDNYGIPRLNRCNVNTGTTAHPCIQKVDQNGGTSYPSSTSWMDEIALDVESVHAMCQNCNILLIEAASTSSSDLIGAADQRAITMGANVVSNSWGGGESSGETSVDSYFNHPGVPYVFSSGDNGYGVQYPAASPNVTAVGGTHLLVNTDYSYNSETAWSGAGSGCSSYEPKPSFQHDTGCPSHRTVADVSADADPSTGASVYINGSWHQIGGTSLAAPLVAAVFALAGGVGNTLGNSLPYANLNYGVNLHDVTSGSNGSCSGSYLCTAMTGFDGPTGLGTPKGTTAFTSPGSLQPVSVDSVFTTDQNGPSADLGNNPRVISGDSLTLKPSATKTQFNPGDPIWLIIAANNHNSTDESASFQWIVLDPNGQDVPALEANGNRDTAAGIVDWPLSSTIPAGSPPGKYTFTGKITFNGVTTSTSTNFYVNGSYRIYLPLVLKNTGGSSPSGIVNGDFESGSTSWTEYSYQGYYPVITSSLPVTPHSGIYAAWLGGADDEITYVQQQVSISAGAPYLVYWQWIGSVDDCGNDFGEVLVNGTVVDDYDLCVSTNTSDWVTHSVDLSAYTGQSIMLQIRAVTNASVNSNLFVDDVSLQATAAAIVQSNPNVPNPGAATTQGKSGIVVQKTKPSGAKDERRFPVNENRRAL